MCIRSYILVILISYTTVVYGQTVSENFDHGSVVTSEANCWEFDDTDIGTDNSINSGGSAPQAQGDIDGLLTDAWLQSPFVQFNGSGNITFKHKMEGDEWYYTYAQLRIYLVDVNGTGYGPYFSHTYRQLSFFNSSPNGDPTIVQIESVPVSWTGFYRVEWYWSGANCYDDGLVDDIVIPKDTSTFQEYDTVCIDDLNVLYEPSYSTSSGSFDYSWSWVGASGGSLTTLTGNDRRAQVDWTIAPGDYKLKVEETYDGGCEGRTTVFNIYVSDRSSVSASIDTVCEDEQATVDFTFAGTGPWTLRYKIDNGSTQTLTSSNPNATLTLPVGATDFEMINLKDQGPCNGTINGLPTVSAYYYPLPATGPVYHY